MAERLTPDLCVIGAGAGGLAAVEAARALGASVVLVERGELGGNALHTGAVPARAFAIAAERAHQVRTAARFGISADNPKVSFRRVHDHVEQVIAGLSPHNGLPRYEALGAEIVRGEARFADKSTLVVNDLEIRARRFILATGGRPVVPQIPGLDAVPYFTSDTILDNTRKLTHLVIIGGTPRAIELAQAYCRLGTEVTVVAAADMLPGFDRELAEVTLRRLGEEGVKLHAHTEVVAIQARSMGIGVVIRSGEAERPLDVSHILVATERVPELAALDLGKAGVKMDKAHPAHLQLKGLMTSNRRILAIGDAGASGASVHAALRDAQIAVRHALLGFSAQRAARLVPRLVETDPAIAEIGLNEAEARRRHGIGFRVSRWSFAENDKARIAADTSGFAKLITDRFGRILGAAVVGPGAGETIALFALAIANGLTMRHLLRFVAPYPSHAEIVSRLATEYLRHEKDNPLLRHWMALVRLLG